MWMVSSSSTIWTLILWGLAVNCLVSGSEPHPCASVSCYYNAMCVVDPDTNLGFCDCRSNECDSYPYFPVCADGITFHSYCHAHMYMCENQREIKVQHGGVCNSFDCGPTTSCRFHGICIEGSCECNPCNGTTFDIDLNSNPSQPVCGSNGIRYDSKCLMEYESCLSQKSIEIAKESKCVKESVESKLGNLMVDHLRHWISEIESEDEKTSEHDNEITSRRTRGTIDVCQNVELRGCLPESHPRKQYLGTYAIKPDARLFDSPVYKRVTPVRSNNKTVYLSRFKYSKAYNGTWIIGSQVGNGRGWFAVSDPASNPRNISKIWYSTSGSRKSPWRKEPTIRLHCRGDKLKRKHPLHECIDDEVVIGTYEINSKNGTDDIPFYRVTLTNKSGKSIETYRPGERVKVTVRHSDLTNRFNTIYLVMRNDVDECGVPGLRRARKRFTSSCYGQMISREAGRMGKIKMQFNMPLRGCVTFNILLKSTKDEVFYDFSSTESGITRYLTKTLCPNTESVY